jgi:hypothetical protein
MRQLRSVDATFLYEAASRAITQPGGLSAFEPRGHFGESFFEQSPDNLTSCKQRSRSPRDRRSIVERTTSGARGKVVRPRRDRGVGLVKSEA